MMSEPEYKRENVIFLDKGGHLFANHRALASATKILKPVPGVQGMLTDGTRMVVAPPTSEKPNSNYRDPSSLRSTKYGTPSSTTTTGPYRRIYSDPGQWWDADMHASFASPATNSASEGPYGDTGFIYSGGWSSSGADSADAGLQYSAARNVADLFLVDRSIGGAEIINDLHEFGPDTDIEIAFSIGAGQQPCYRACNDPANLQAYAFGSWVGGGYGGVTIAIQPTNINDWAAYGTVLKHMVSIGQSNPPDGVAKDGYTFGFVNLGCISFAGPGFNLCWTPTQGAGHYFAQNVPDSNIVESFPITGGERDAILL